MKRDMELIRTILLKIQDGKLNEQIDGISDDVLKYHQFLLVNANLVEGIINPNYQTTTDIPAAVFIKNITWEGHDFIDAIQDTDRWSKVKGYLKDSGKIVTIETIKAAVKYLFMQLET